MTYQNIYIREGDYTTTMTRRPAPIEFKRGDIVYIKKSFQRYGEAPTWHEMVGMVVKAYEGGRAFIRSIKDDFPEARKKAYKRYGVAKDEGYYITREDVEDPTTWIFLYGTQASVYTYETTTCKTVKLNGSLITRHHEGYPHNESLQKTTVVRFRGTKDLDRLTWVYLHSDDIGAFADGDDVMSRDLATYRALVQKFERRVHDLEGLRRSYDEGGTRYGNG